MQTFDQSIYEHYKAGRITYEDALSYATNPDEFKLRVQGIYTTKDAAIEAMEKEMAGRCNSVTRCSRDSRQTRSYLIAQSRSRPPC